MLYMLNEESIELIRRQLANPGAMRPAPITPTEYQPFPVMQAAEWYEWKPTRSIVTANDHLTLSAAHRLIQSLSEQTQSRAELDECRDVMAKLERMVADA